MRQYARHLKKRVDRDELAGSTANTYWNYIAAFLGWCVYEELLAENPARKRRAEQELPGTRSRSDRQQSGVEPTEKRFSPISTSELTRPSTNKV